MLPESTRPIAPDSDVEQLASIQDHLATADLPLAEHLVDTSYVRTRNLVASRRDHQIELIGLIYEDRAWQARADADFALAQFQIVTRPQGHTSVRWEGLADGRKPNLIHVGFARADCRAFPVRT